MSGFIVGQGIDPFRCADPVGGVRRSRNALRPWAGLGWLPERQINQYSAFSRVHLASPKTPVDRLGNRYPWAEAIARVPPDDDDDRPDNPKSTAFGSDRPQQNAIRSWPDIPKNFSHFAADPIHRPQHLPRASCPVPRCPAPPSPIGKTRLQSQEHSPLSPVMPTPLGQRRCHRIPWLPTAAGQHPDTRSRPAP